jgi:hypothetical protein
MDTFSSVPLSETTTTQKQKNKITPLAEVNVGALRLLPKVRAS